jgi:hypothetical protein
MPNPEPIDPDIGRPTRIPAGQRSKLALAAAGLLVLGGAAGAVVATQSRPAVSMAPATPIPIARLSSSGIVTLRGRVAEIYGNKVILADGSGRALVDLGREGEEASLVTLGEPITVQGRFDRGFVRAAFLIGPDNKVLALGPLAGPPHGRHGPHRRHGPDDGPDIAPPAPGVERGDEVPPAPAGNAVATMPAAEQK